MSFAFLCNIYAFCFPSASENAPEDERNPKRQMLRVCAVMCEENKDDQGCSSSVLLNGMARAGFPVRRSMRISRISCS